MFTAWHLGLLTTRNPRRLGEFTTASEAWETVKAHATNATEAAIAKWGSAMARRLREDLGHLMRQIDGSITRPGGTTQHVGLVGCYQVFDTDEPAGWAAELAHRPVRIIKPHWSLTEVGSNELLEVSSAQNWRLIEFPHSEGYEISPVYQTFIHGTDKRSLIFLRATTEVPILVSWEEIGTRVVGPNRTLQAFHPDFIHPTP